MLRPARRDRARRRLLILTVRFLASFFAMRLEPENGPMN